MLAKDLTKKAAGQCGYISLANVFEITKSTSANILCSIGVAFSLLFFFFSYFFAHLFLIGAKFLLDRKLWVFYAFYISVYITQHIHCFEKCVLSRKAINSWLILEEKRKNIHKH